MDQVDPDTGEDLPNLGIYNDEDGKYAQFKTPNTVKNALYLMYANAPLNSQMYSYCKTQLKNGNLKFLIDEANAKAKLMAQAQGKKMTPSQREDYLRPYVETSILRNQMINLVQNNEGQNIILKQHNVNIKKDKFSALIYGLWWCHETEVKRNRRKGASIADYMFFTKKN